MVSFITPPFIGAVAWVLLAAPNSGLLNQYYRWITGAGPFDHLFNIFSSAGIIFVMGSYAFPYVFVLAANTLDRLPYDLEEASAILGGGRWHTFRRVTLPMVLPALLAGFLIAFLQAMTQFGTPAILALPAGFHVLTTKIWSLFQYPPQDPSGRRLRDAAAAGHHRFVARREVPARPPRLYHDRRQDRRAATDAAWALALARAVGSRCSCCS